MTFELLEAIIAKNKIPKNVRLVNNSENDLCTTDMNGIQYCEKRNEICFMEAECIHKPEHAEKELWGIQDRGMYTRKIIILRLIVVVIEEMDVWLQFV